MPELPEVETIRTGITPYLINQSIQSIQIHQPKLRWIIPEKLIKILPKQAITNVSRRAKYLILTLNKGHLIIHLGMSGKLYLTDKNNSTQKHDHVDIILKNNLSLRLNDQRRFGCMLWTEEMPNMHKLLANLGVEPLTDNFNAEFLFQQCQNRKTPIKSLIMNQNIVVGVGNIYATEALFNSKISPVKPANQLTLPMCKTLVTKIKSILNKAIELGGTTIKDFVNSHGKPGYFQQTLKAYGQTGKPCYICKLPLVSTRINQRNTTYCKNCQQ